MQQNYRPDFTYADFAPQFTAEFYNASQWAELFQVSFIPSLYLFMMFDVRPVNNV